MSARAAAPVLPATSRPLIALTIRILEHRLGRQWMGGRHTRECRAGMWLDGYGGPDGAPCSDWCQRTRDALTAWQDVARGLDADVPRQLVLGGEAAG